MPTATDKSSSLGKPPDIPEHKLRPPSQTFAIFLCGAIAFFDLYATQPMLPLLSHVFHATETHVTLTLSASTIGVAITAILLALFGQALPRKRMIVYSMAALAVCTLLTATTSALNVLIFWRFIQGLVTPGIFILTITYITEEWIPRRVPQVMSYYVAGTVFGGFTGRLLGGVIAAHFGWRASFLFLGILLVLGAIITHFFLYKPHTPLHATEKSHLLEPIVACFQNPRLLATFGIGFCMLFVLISVFSYITFYLAAAPFHLATDELSYLFAVYLVGLVATLIAGRYLEHHGLRNGILFALGLCILGVAITLVHSLTVVALGLAIFSSGVFITQTCANSYLRDASPAASRVAAVGLYIFWYYVGGTVGGIVPGIVYHQAQWPGCVALTCAILAFAAALAFLGWPANYHQGDTKPDRKIGLDSSF